MYSDGVIQHAGMYLSTSDRLHDTHLSPIPLKLGDSSSRWHLSDLGPLRDTHLAVFSPKIGHNSWGSSE